jgi:hypothetical protein
VNGAISPEHPDDDLLADLAADVLPTHQARAVEAHVMACARCTSLLTDAAQMRNVLLSDDPGPMPPDILARLDQALQIEVAAREGMGDHPAPTAPNPVGGSTFGSTLPSQLPLRSTPQPRVISPWEDTTTIEAFESARKRQAAQRRASTRPSEGDSGPATPSAASGIAAPRSLGPRLTRPSRGPSRSRRDLREEVRDVKAGRRRQSHMVLAGAAVVVVLLGLGGYVVVGLLGNREATNATSAASSVESQAKSVHANASNGPPMLATGTNYTGTDLAQQAKVLVGQAGQGGTQQRSTAPRMSGPQAAAAGSAPSTAGTLTAEDAGNQSLRNPATLNGCLSALQAGGRRPVAVDLARYEGRDAAVIVLNGTNGGYEVWVVARDCRPGADGTIKYLDLTP